MVTEKVVSRKYALAFGVLCVVLMVIVGGVLQLQIANLQSQLSSDKSATNSMKSTIAKMNATITNLEGQLSLDPNRIINGFSIIQITDTQYLSDTHSTLYDGLTSWIAEKANALNLTMVVHTGDIVQVPNSTIDWQNASNAMMTLFNNGIPYCWNAGNHDQIDGNGTAGSGNPNGSWIGGNYPAFSVTTMRHRPYWVGDIFGGKNTAAQFTYGNYHFMIINIEYNANQAVLDWMQTIIKANPNVNVIVAAHDFLNGVGNYGTSKSADKTWATNFEKLLGNYPNVFMTLNGHAAQQGMGTAFNKKVGNREEVFFNRQMLVNDQGAACARIYTFEISNPASATVNVYTYQTFNTPNYITDPLNQFNFNTNLKAYWPSTVNVAKGTDFLEASGCKVDFASSAAMNGFSQNGNSLTFNGLNLNGANSNFTFTTLGADVTISKYDVTSGISYTVSGIGSQTFSLNNAPVSVDIDGRPASKGWTYSKGEVAVTGATSSVVVNLH
ncbi:MAG: metallophosphoesterase [Candidatus Bathyarchaeia archaeon]|jgi:hypothetical protein